MVVELVEEGIVQQVAARVPWEHLFRAKFLVWGVVTLMVAGHASASCLIPQ